MVKSVLVAGVLAMGLLLAGCEDTVTEMDFKMPKGLEDCKIYRLTNKGGSSIEIARCPNSTTSSSYKEGKTTKNVIVVDGIAYEAKSDEPIQPVPQP